MRMTRIMTVVFIGVLIVLSACAKPIPAVTTPPVTTPPATTPPVTTPPATAPPATTPPTITPPPPTPVQGLYDIWIPGREFRPSVLTVPLVTKVTWTNKDSEPHTIISDTGLFSGTVGPLVGTFSYTFNQTGTFEYNCDIHPGMTGKITVQ